MSNIHTFLITLFFLTFSSCASDTPAESTDIKTSANISFDHEISNSSPIVPPTNTSDFNNISNKTINESDTRELKTSNFNYSSEGWRSSQEANITWMPRGGNPGGFLLGEDQGDLGNSSSTWYFVSPENWSGNWTSFIGSNLSFDLKVIRDEDTREFPIYDDLVQIHCKNNTTLYYPGLIHIWPDEPNGSWKTYQIPLVPLTFGCNTTEFSDSLKQVQNISIRGEFGRGMDMEGLDNVMIVPQNRPVINGNEKAYKDHKDNDKVEPSKTDFHHKSDKVLAGLKDNGGSGVGSSSSFYESNRIALFAEDTGWGTHWASGAVWDEFLYNSQGHLNRIIVKSHIFGDLTLIATPDILLPSNGHVDLSVNLIVLDKTDNIVIAEKEIYRMDSHESKFFSKLIDEDVSGYVDVDLIEGHEYRVTLYSKITSTTEIVSSSIVDFSSNGRGIFWIYDAVEWI